MAVNVTDLKRGDILEMDGDPWLVTEIASQTPSTRGASMLVKAKLRNLRTSQGLAKTWRGAMVTAAEVEYRTAQFSTSRATISYSWISPATTSSRSTRSVWATAPGTS